MAHIFDVRWRILSILLVLIFSTSLAHAQEFEGKWLISLQDKNRTLVGLLELEKQHGSWIAHLEGGPAQVDIQNNSIVILADSRDVRGFVFNRRLKGVLANGQLNGSYTQEGDSAQKEQPGSWSAERWVEPKRMASQDIPDISGMWSATQNLDFRKYTMAIAPKGEQWLEGYLPYYDQPDVRCTSIGLPALATYSFPFEVLKSESRYTFIYEYQSKVRRIWMDDRPPAQFIPPSRMGHSVGHWEGNTLVIWTSHLEPTVRDFRGELISENAKIEERYTLAADGQTLTAIITVQDPEYYSRPPVRRRQWRKDGTVSIFPYTCDPDSFYIPLYEEGKMDMYIERIDNRF